MSNGTKQCSIDKTLSVLEQVGERSSSWNSFISQQPSSIQEIISNSKYSDLSIADSTGSDITKAIPKLSKADCIVVVSDGSAKEDQMSYG